MNEEGGVLKVLAFMQRTYLIKHKDSSYKALQHPPFARQIFQKFEVYI
jgi:hypothetical protein